MSVMLSIIVPAYNAEAYLEECIESIEKSVFRDFEILIIDDGSTDRTATICDRLQGEYAEIKVVHTENQGLPSARNVGIEMATGRYIGFVDADDLVSPHLFETLVSCASSDVQLCACGFCRCLRDSVTFEQGCTKTEYDQLGTAEEIYRGSLGPYVWNKLYRKDILDKEKIRFMDDCRWGEDILFNASYVKHCTKTVFVEQKMYAYISTSGSITNAFRESRFVGDRYMSIPKSWRRVSEEMEHLSSGLTDYARARTAMFYQTVLRKLQNPSDGYICESVEYVKKHKSVLLRYKWGIKYYLSAIILTISYSLWAKIFRR